MNIATGDLDRPDVVGFQSGIPTWAQPRAIDIGRVRRQRDVAIRLR